jgi:putative membrane protein
VTCKKSPHFPGDLNLAKIVLFILSVILVATFCTLNRQEISLRYFFGWNTALFPLFLLLLASLILGMVAGFLIGWIGRWNLRTEARHLRKQLKALEGEIENLTPKEEGSAPSPQTSEVNKPPSS